MEAFKIAVRTLCMLPNFDQSITSNPFFSLTQLTVTASTYFDANGGASGLPKWRLSVSKAYKPKHIMMGSLKQEYQKAYLFFPFYYKKDQTSLFLLNFFYL